MDKNKREQLEWLVQFANLDIGELKAGDKAKLSVEADEYLFRRDILKINNPDLQRDVSLSLSIILKYPEKDSQEYWNLIYDLQQRIKGEFHIIKLNLDPSQPGPHYINLLHEPLIHEVFFALDGNKFRFINLPFNVTHEAYIYLKVHFLLDDLPATALQECLSCGKWILNISKREKRFCTPKCMFRYNSARRMEELKKDPKKYREYLDKQADLMRKKYEKKKKDTLGEKVKVKKRKKG